MPTSVPARLKLCFLISAFSFSASSFAYCTVKAGAPSDTFSLDLNMSEISASPGTELRKIDAPSYTRVCGGSVRAGSTDDTGLAELLPTGPAGSDGFVPVIPGLSARIYVRRSVEPEHMSANTNEGYFGGADNYPIARSALKFDRSYEVTYMPSIQLKRTSDGLVPGDYRVLIGSTKMANSKDIYLKISVPTITCSVSLPNQRVTLPDESSTVIHKLPVGGTSAASRDFSIALNCPQAMQPMHLTFTDQNSSGVSPYFQLSPTSTASGVAVQMQTADLGTRVAPGSPVLLIEPGKSGPRAIDFVARYAKTADSVIPGNVRATATFTVTYD